MKGHYRMLPAAFVEKIVRKIKARYDGVIAAFLFGSLAEANCVESSDLELEIVLESARQPHGGVRPFLIDHVYVEPHIHGKERFMKAGQLASTKAFGSHIVNSIIVYDPTGFFDNIKKEMVKLQ